MPQVLILKPFKFAHRGIDVEEFEPSDELRDISDEVFEIAQPNGWADTPENIAAAKAQRQADKRAKAAAAAAPAVEAATPAAATEALPDAAAGQQADLVAAAGAAPAADPAHA